MEGKKERSGRVVENLKFPNFLVPCICTIRDHIIEIVKCLCDNKNFSGAKTPGLSYVVILNEHTIFPETSLLLISKTHILFLRILVISYVISVCLCAV